jgi:hypothetical protein
VPLGAGGGSLRHILIHIANDPQPLLVVLNSGEQAVEARGPALPEWYGGFRGIELCVATQDAALHLANGQVGVRLPAYGFAVGQLRTSALPFAVVDKEARAVVGTAMEQEVA